MEKDRAPPRRTDANRVGGDCRHAWHFQRSFQPRGKKPHLRLKTCQFIGGIMYRGVAATGRSEEHTPELQSLLRTSSAVFALKKQITTEHNNSATNTVRHHHILQI